MPLSGYIDSVSHEGVSGWAYDSDTPDQPVTLLITADDILLARILADRHRPDLQQAGIGNGRHGFQVRLTGLSPLARYLIAVRRESDGMDLAHSPSVLEAAGPVGSTLRHHCAALLESVTNDKEIDDTLGFLAAQTETLLQKRAMRRGKLAERAALAQIKWRWTEGDPDAPAASLPLRALVIEDLPPRIGHDAGSNALLSHMAALRRLGFEVSFAAGTMATDQNNVLDAAGVTFYASPWHGSVEEVLRREANGFDLVYLYRAHVAWRYLALVQYHQPKARIIFSVADLHHVRIARQAQVEDRQELIAVARYYATIERQLAYAVHSVITHSAEEAVALRRLAPQARLGVVPWVITPQPTLVPFAARSGLAFIGHFAHAPNLDAAYWLIDEIMPELHKSRPDLECTLVGSQMPDRLRQPRPGISALGRVPQLADVFDRVRLTIAPLAFGAGIKGKVLDSMAAGVPCVCTSVAAEGMELPDSLRVLIADDVIGLAQIVLRLHDDAEFNQACSEAGLAYITARYSEERVDADLRDAIGIPAFGAT